MDSSEVIIPAEENREETPEAEAQPVETVVETSPEPDAAPASEEVAPAEEGSTVKEVAAAAEPTASDETASPEQPAEETAAVGMDASQLLGDAEQPAESVSADEIHLRAMLEAIIYITEEPLTVDQIAAAIEQPKERVVKALQALAEEYAKPERGVTIREVAGGYRMGTKPEHHEAIRTFVKKMKPPLKLSLAALETLAVIAYKQPITAPEIMEIRGVQGAGVLKTLLDRKLIIPAGRKQVVGKPILYKTTKDFLVQFGLKDLAELPTLKEFEELRRLAFNEPEDSPAPEAPQEAVPEPAQQALDIEPTPETRPEPQAEPQAEPELQTAPEDEVEAKAEAEPEAQPEQEAPPEKRPAGSE